MADFAALDLDTLRKLAADERMGPAQQERIAARIAELAQAPEPPGESPCSLTREVKPGKRRGKQNLTETRAFKDLIAPR
ncbi:MAG TPA: hypothetical protein VFI96_01840, partial [Longimicrobiaceae bacterium]|nr:hypothetical protein [Longimicrobiaceae bacterium]